MWETEQKTIQVKQKTALLIFKGAAVKKNLNFLAYN